MVCAGSSQECGEAGGLASAGGESDLWTRWSDILKTWDKRQKTANIKVISAANQSRPHYRARAAKLASNECCCRSWCGGASRITSAAWPGR